MALFSNSILKNYKQDEGLIALRWAAFQSYLAKLDFVKTVKEEKYQDGFLHDIFENCLGYTLDSTNHEDYNLEREKKNETDGKKADGAIYVDGKVLGIIELKAQDTKNLDKASDQAFGYLVSNSDAHYVVVSNFDELRFYVDKKTAYEKFHLFSLDYEAFKRLHLILSYESISQNLPLTLKAKSNSFEQEISKQLYKDFSAFRMQLFENIVLNNATSQECDRAILLRLTQKLCDRIIFILFAEDRGLLHPNTIKEIRERHAQDIMGNPMYGYYKIYFDAINQGNEKLGIPKYNGGLFAKDEQLDGLIIDDQALDVHAQKLSDYDFDSEVGVNILGHIFEQSLTDLEEIQASIEHTDFDKKQGKRKKDGVFYTPEYITKYIVDNTLGKLCTEKKETLDLTRATSIAPNNPKKLTKAEQTHKQNIQAYRDWLTNLKILDPACGSGAFLNQALEFLIAEHTLVRDMLLPYQDLTLNYEIEKEILEHNLYGVDINEDAVEIAKLSLWLRTAHKGRELTKLADKIKCGNSLIDDKSVVENAFVWEEEFAEVFAQGGFDVVIGNPPYVRQEMLAQEAKNHFASNYETYHGMADLYVFFVERAFKLLKIDGKFSYIFPNKWMKAGYGKPLRKFLLSKCIDRIVDFGDLPIFEDATTYPLILTMQHSEPKESFCALEIQTLDFPDLSNYVNKNMLSIPIGSLNEDVFSLNGISHTLIEKLKHNSILLGEYLHKELYRGILTGFNDAFIIDEKTKNELIESDLKSAELIKPFLAGRDLKRYTMPKVNKYLIFTRRGTDIDKYPAIKLHLEQYKDQLLPKPKNYKGTWKGRKEGKYAWYEIQDTVAYYQNFEKTKIIYQETSMYRSFTLDEKNLYTNKTIFIIPRNELELLGVLNSKLIWFYLGLVVPKVRGGTYTLQAIFMEQLPIKLPTDDNFKLLVSKMLTLNKQLQETKQNFIKELELEKVPKKLQNFEELEFDEFVKEYKKAKKLKFSDKLEERNFKQEWQALFENDKTLTSQLKTEIAKTDKEIDQMVYKLYELTDDEIKIVEGNG